MASARIVIADDDPAILQTMTWVLKEHGYDVGSASGGRELMTLLEERTPDLLLLDVMFSDVDGFQLLERIKNDDRWRDMPVLMISSLPPEEAAVKTLGLGASDFVRKPFRVRELLARIQAQLRMRAILRSAYDSLRLTEEELARARAEAESRRKLVDILREVTGDLTSDEIYHVLARRVARALDLTRCSVILARPGDKSGIVAASFEHALVKNFELNLDRYPEIRAALETGQPVLVEDVHSSPLYADIRERWREEGTQVPIRSVIAMPFSLADARQSGVFFLRRGEDERPLREDDVAFADTVVRAAVAAVQRANMMESTRADNRRLEALAQTDPLTDALNRRALDRSAECGARARSPVRLDGHAAHDRHRSLQADQRHVRTPRGRRRAHGPVVAAAARSAKRRPRRALWRGRIRDRPSGDTRGRRRRVCRAYSRAYRDASVLAG